MGIRTREHRSALSGGSLGGAACRVEAERRRTAPPYLGGSVRLRPHLHGRGGAALPRNLTGGWKPPSLARWKRAATVAAAILAAPAKRDGFQPRTSCQHDGCVKLRPRSQAASSLSLTVPKFSDARW